MNSEPESLAQYQKRRETLITQDRSARKDAALNANCSSVERVADEKLRAIRQWEIENLWNADKLPANETNDVNDLFPGMGFLTARDRIEKSQLFNLLKEMPKGGLLHCHIDATVNMRTLLKLALERTNIHIRIHEPFPAGLTSLGKCQTTDLPLPEFRTLGKAVDISEARSIAHQDYKMTEWIPMVIARENFPIQLGGPEGFDLWIYRALTIDPTEAYKTHATVTKIWQKFGSVFGVLDGLIRNEPVFRAYIRESLLEAIRDKLSYIECRILFYFKTMYNADGDDVLPHAEWLKMFRDSINSVHAELKEQGRSKEFIGAKIIYTTMRDISREEMTWYMEDCIALKQQFPDLIAGFDIVGPENEGKPLIYFLEEFLNFKRRVKELGLDLPLILHAGECLGDGDEVDSNLYDAILLGTKRIGHGFSLVKHPHLMDLCKRNDVTIEVCPISNEVLRLTSTMPLHPLAIMLAHGVPMTINSDDPAIWTSTGVSFDYYQVLISSEVTGLMTLYELAKRSLEASCLDSDEKARAISNWEEHWMAWVKHLVLTETMTEPGAAEKSYNWMEARKAPWAGKE